MNKELRKISDAFVEALKRKEARLHSLLQTDNRVLVYLSPTHLILEFNKEAEQVYGLRREEVLGKDYFELFLPKSKWKKAAEDIRQILAGEPCIGFEGRVMSSDFRATHLSWNVVPILGKQGASVGIFAAGLDITEIRRHREALKEIVKKRSSEINTVMETLRPKIVDRKYAEEVLRKKKLPKDLRFKTSGPLFVQIDAHGTIISMDDQAEHSLEILRAKIAERKHAEDLLRKTRLSKDLRLRKSRAPFIQIDASGTIIFWDHQAELIFGWSKKEVIGRLFNEIIIPQRLREIRKMSIHHFLAEGDDALFKRIFLSAEHRSGKEFPVEMVLWMTKIGPSYFFNIFMQGIAAHKKAEKKEYLATTLINAANEAIISTDLHGNILSVNPAFSRITGYSVEEVIGKNPSILKSKRHDKGFYKAMWDKITTSGHWAGEIWNRRKNGEIFPEWLSITALKDKQGNVIQYVAFYIDITGRKEDETKLYRRAHYDELTGLPNRTLFKERLLQNIKLTKRNRKKSALLFLDLDKFKQVNDTFGHMAGDRILNEAGKRMLTCIREADTVARYSGDEFLVILSDITDRKDSVVVTNKIIEKLSSPFLINDRNISISASIGITIIPDDGEEIAVLLNNADRAMYQAKSLGRNRFYFFNRELRTEKYSPLESDIRRGIEQQEFVIYYQAIIDLVSSKTIGLEALIRWEHPDHGLILPDQFMPTAEKSDLICEIGEWALKKACKQAKHWRDDYRYSGAISVNVSNRQLNDSDFDAVLKQALEESGLLAQHLTIEIVGGFLLEKDDKWNARYKKLKDLGVKLSIHDFGREHIPLSKLSRHPIDQLKIDKPFIQNFSLDPKKISLVSAIVSMGHHLNMKVLAMGIETDQEMSFLKGLGCDGGQGYLIAKPLSAEGFEAVLKEKMIALSP